MNEFQRLTNDQYYRAQASARERVRNELGERPTLNSFIEEREPVWRREDFALVIVAIMAFILSAIHVFGYVGELATEVYDSKGAGGVAGIALSRSLYVVLHQIGFTLLAEFSILSFMIVLGLNPRVRREDGTVYDTLGSLRRGAFYLLAVVAIIFTIVANVSSGLPVGVAIIVPLITVGIGFYVESKVVETVKRSRKAEGAYRRKMEQWELATRDSDKHPEYRRYLAEELLQSLLKLKKNKLLAGQYESKYGDVPTGVKVALVEREMERESWTSELGRAGEEAPPDDTEEVTDRVAEVAEMIAPYWNGKKFTITFAEMKEAVGGVSNTTLSQARKVVSGG